MNIEWGRMLPTFNVSCGRCKSAHEALHISATRTEAAAEAKRGGWWFTRGFGWICSECAEDLASGCKKPQPVESDGKLKT